MRNIKINHISGDDFSSDFDSATEEDLLGEESDNLLGPVFSPTQYTPKSQHGASAIKLADLRRKTPSSSL